MVAGAGQQRQTHHIMYRSIVLKAIQWMPYGYPSFMSLHPCLCTKYLNTWSIIQKSRRTCSTHAVYQDYKDMLTSDINQVYDGGTGQQRQTDVYRSIVVKTLPWIPTVVTRQIFRSFVSLSHDANTDACAGNQIWDEVLRRVVPVDYVNQVYGQAYGVSCWKRRGEYRGHPSYVLTRCQLALWYEDKHTLSTWTGYEVFVDMLPPHINRVMYMVLLSNSKCSGIYVRVLLNILQYSTTVNTEVVGQSFDPVSFCYHTKTGIFTWLTKIYACIY